MTQFWIDILSAVLVPVLGILTTYLVKLIKAKLDELEAATKNDRLKRYLGIAEDAITSAVAAVSQTYVDALKKENAFTAEAQKEAFGRAKDLALQIISNKALDAIRAEMGDVELTSWIGVKIEQAVREKV